MRIIAEMKNQKNKIILAQVFLIILLGFVVYSNSLHGKFIWDDYCYIKNNIYITNFSYLPKLFVTGAGAGSDIPSFFYRPLQIFTYMLDYTLWGFNVFGYHLINTILHIIVSLCIYWMLATIFEEQSLAFLASLLFLAHPVHVEAVASMSGRADPLSAVFMLISIVLYLKQPRSQNKKLCFLSLLSFALALLSKESALIMPLLLLLYHYAFKSKINRSLFLSFLGINLIYIILRVLILQKLLITSLLPYTPSAAVFISRIPAFFAAVTGYLRILIFPMNLHVDYGAGKFNFTDYKIILGAAITISLIAYALMKKEKDKLLFFSVFWFYLALLPTANIYKINESFMKEHWLYIPSIGFFLILAKALSSLYRNKSLRTQAVVFTATIVLCYSSLTIRQNIYWSDPFIFMKKSLQYSNNYIFYNELGRECENTGKYEEAIAFYKEAIALNPKKYYLYCNLGRSYKTLGMYKESIAAFQKASEINTKNKLIYYELGDSYDKVGQKQEAIKAYLHAVEIDHNYLEAYNNLGALYADAGEIDKAIQIWNRIIAIKPDFATAHFNLAVFYFGQKKFDLAIKHCDEVIKLGDKVNPEFLELLEPYRKK